MSTLTYPLQPIFGKAHDRRLRRSRRLRQHWRQNNHYLRFADDIDGLAGEEEELAKLVESLDKAFTTYSMKISAEKTKLVKNNTSDIKKEIKVNRPSLETVTSFKYLGSVVSDECSKTEILFRIAKTTAILTSLE